MNVISQWYSHQRARLECSEQCNSIIHNVTHNTWLPPPSKPGLPSSQILFNFETWFPSNTIICTITTSGRKYFPLSTAFHQRNPNLEQYFSNVEKEFRVITSCTIKLLSIVSCLLVINNQITMCQIQYQESLLFIVSCQQIMKVKWQQFLWNKIMLETNVKSFSNQRTLNFMTFLRVTKVRVYNL